MEGRRGGALDVQEEVIVDDGTVEAGGGVDPEDGIGIRWGLISGRGRVRGSRNAHCNCNCITLEAMN